MVLEPLEKKQIIAEVVSLATRPMFRKYFYKFGGRMYHQKQGGPIGLRSTCAVARLVMPLFDEQAQLRLCKLGPGTVLMF